MTSQQKDWVLFLILANLFVFCCALPNLLIFFDVSDSKQQVKDALLPIIPTPGPTKTPGLVVLPNRPVPTPTVEVAWKLYIIPNQGFAVTVPVGWESLDLGIGVLGSALQTLRQKNPVLADSLLKRTASVSASTVRFVAYDASANAAAAGYPTTMTITRNSFSQTPTLDALVNNTIQQVEKMNGFSKPIVRRPLLLAAGEAEELRYHITLSNNTIPPLQSATSQYVLLHAKDAYIITLSTDGKLEGQHAITFEKIGVGFRFIGN
jgi:hypothetical protein